MTPIAELRRLYAAYPAELGKRAQDYIYGPFGPETAYKVLTLTCAALKERIPGFHVIPTGGDWLADGKALCGLEVSTALERGYILHSAVPGLRADIAKALTPCELLALAARLHAANRKQSDAAALRRYEQQRATA